MQTRLRSRLGLSGADALPEPVPLLRSAAPATSSSSSAKRVAQRKSSGTNGASAAVEGGAGEDSAVVVAPPELAIPTPLPEEEGNGGFVRVTRRRAAAAAAAVAPSSIAGEDDNSGVVVVLDSSALTTMRCSHRVEETRKAAVNSASVSAVASGSTLSSRRTVSLNEPAAKKSNTHRSDGGGRRAAAPRSVWRQVFLNAVASRGFSTPQTQKASRKMELQRSMQSAVDEALGRARHEQRMRLIAENQESEFLVDLLQEKRERKRLRYEARKMATPNRKVVLVDSDASDGIGGEENVVVASSAAPPSPSSLQEAHPRPRCSKLQLRRRQSNHSDASSKHEENEPRLNLSRPRKARRREEEEPSEDDYGNAGEESFYEEDDAADKILRVMDALDKQFRLFDATRDAAAAKCVEQRGGGGGRRRLRLSPQQQALAQGNARVTPVFVTASPSQVTCAATSAQSFPRLMPFQREGVQWMMETMTQHHLNVILADDMGLGKTVSSIALMRALVNLHEIFVDAHPLPSAVVEPTAECNGNERKKGGPLLAEGKDEKAAADFTAAAASLSSTSRPRRAIRASSSTKSFLESLHDTYRHHVIKPMLVVAPLSTLPNWEREFAEFEPNVFEVFVINGSRVEREEAVEHFLERVQGMWGERLHRPGGRRFRAARDKRSTRTTTQQRRWRRTKHHDGSDTAPVNTRHLVLWGSSSASSSGRAKVLVPVLVLPHGYFVEVSDWRGRALLETVQWHLVVMDEAQRIKNNSCKLFKAMSQIASPLRLVLTGTPLQNNVLEMFSLLEFILPQRFYSKDPATKRLMLMLHETLTHTSARAETNFVDEELEMLLCRRVHRFLAPFLLRREKSAVLSQLPVKDDVVIVCPVTPVQTAYLAAAERRRDAKKLSGSFTLLVRKVLMHPYLCLNSFYVDERVVYASGKFVVLDILLRFLNRFQHKVLVFSTWTTMLDIVESLCIWRNISCVRLEGKTAVPDREHNIQKFSRLDGGGAEEDDNESSAAGGEGHAEGERKQEKMMVGDDDDDEDDVIQVSGVTNNRAAVNCFLISKIAGGVGLNLQVADTVILLDVDYNPQRDMQALSRVYRVGQTKHVKVFRLVMNHPVEENMVQIALRKQRLDEAVVQAGRYDLRSSAVDRDEHVRLLFERMRSASSNAAAGPLPPPRRISGPFAADEDDDDGARTDLVASRADFEKPRTGQAACKDEDEASAPQVRQLHSLRWAEHQDNGGTWEGLVSDQLMETVPRSADEQAALCEMLCEHWQQLRSCTVAANGVAQDDGGGDDERKFLAA